MQQSVLFGLGKCAMLFKLNMTVPNIWDRCLDTHDMHMKTPILLNSPIAVSSATKLVQ